MDETIYHFIGHIDGCQLENLSKVKSNLLYFYMHPWVNIFYLWIFKHFIVYYCFFIELSWGEYSSSLIRSVIYAFSFLYIVHSMYWCHSTYILLWYRYRCSWSLIDASWDHSHSNCLWRASLLFEGFHIIVSCYCWVVVGLVPTSILVVEIW